MKAGKIVVCVLICALQLAAMSACGFLLEPVAASFVCYLLFLFFGGIITAIILSSCGSKRAKLSMACVLIGLVGIAVIQLCAFFIHPPFFGIVGFIVFLVFASAIALIIFMNKKDFINGNADSLHDNVKREPARHLVRILRSRGVPDAEIRLTVMETFRLKKEIIDEIMQ